LFMYFMKSKKVFMKSNKFFIKVVINILALVVVSSLFDGIIIKDILTLLAVAVVMGILNSIIKPILMIITLPFTVATFGIFLLIVNGFVLWLASALINGFIILNFSVAVWGALVLSIISMIVENMFTKKENRQ
ncbi:MAG: phage holin family protein, partial [Candidatus Marinimicrobia bacterium]|nr:phage holin family protein [Candidatus Neomarinimicrobiota bacterium]